MEILLTAVEDDDLSLACLGILTIFCVRGPIPIEECKYPESYIDLLITKGYVEKTESAYIVKGVEVDEAELFAQYWVPFFKLYPGTKNDIRNNGKQEFDTFKKRWKPGNKYRRILPELLLAVNRQLKERELLQEYNDKMAGSGQKKMQKLIPDWKHLATYLGQKQGWLEALAIPDEALKYETKPVEAAPVSQWDNDAFANFYNWALSEGIAYKLRDQYLKAVLPNRRDFEGMMAGTLSPFTGWEFNCPDDTFKRSIMAWTREYYSNTLFRNSYKDLMEHLGKRYTDTYCSDNV